MIKYVLTRCAAEDNYTPRVFSSKEKAKKAFDELVNQIVEDAEDSLVEEEIYEEKAELEYADETYDVVEIFEVEEE